MTLICLTVVFLMFLVFGVYWVSWNSGFVLPNLEILNSQLHLLHSGRPLPHPRNPSQAMSWDSHSARSIYFPSLRHHCPFWQKSNVWEPFYLNVFFSYFGWDSKFSSCYSILPKSWSPNSEVFKAPPFVAGFEFYCIMVREDSLCVSNIWKS